MPKKSTGALLCALLFVLSWAATAQDSGPVFPQKPTIIDQAMLFRSFVQDAPECAVEAKDGQAVFPRSVASPAATCPDAFAWVSFLEAIGDEFWNWAVDQTVWPAEPWPICGTDRTTDCCPRDLLQNPGSSPNVHCPYNREDFQPVPPLPDEPNGSPSGVVVSHRGAHKQTDVERLDPGRTIRDLEVELVFRNKTMVQYIFDNDMYSREGLASRVVASNAAVRGGDIGKAQAYEVRLPTAATMVKVDFIHQDIMEGEGLIEAVPGGIPNNPDHPYVTVYLEGSTGKLADGSTYDTSGYYYLVAMTNASKALPNWHWYAIEHVANLGRCDFTGCNDSFGYSVNEMMRNGARFGGTYIPPMQRLENNQAVTADSKGSPNSDPNDAIFLLGKVYPPRDYGERMTAELEALYDGLGIGTASRDADPKVLSSTDPAWRNYRLKGTQTDFTTSHGVPTGTGATVTEGGFVNSASCLTCHSQASMNAQGTPGAGGSIGSDWRLNLFGFGQVEMGSPDLAWFFYPGTSDPFAAVQFDFIWGILGAQCITPGKDGACASIPHQPTIIER
jgi:hypothetical protein